ncbi:hypothetical protein [Wolbachia pipientis]|uniref:hypothetical protein n=1 Tax=Wolbachia pipientis TaxID=955 RepID=UPI0025A42187|nr:hypothetical protein [Wolbachia pipientis]MDM8335523.1 hypothetical protein [Wolbachia pipientis]
MKSFLRNFLYHPLSSQFSFLVIPAHNVGMTPRTCCRSNNICTRILLTLLLILFPLLTSPVSAEGIEKNCDYEYYPKLDHNLADELCTIKQNYYRYGEKLKILADKRIKEIREAALSTNNKTKDS